MDQYHSRSTPPRRYKLALAVTTAHCSMAGSHGRWEFLRAVIINSAFTNHIKKLPFSESLPKNICMHSLLEPLLNSTYKRMFEDLGSRRILNGCQKSFCGLGGVWLLLHVVFCLDGPSRGKMRCCDNRGPHSRWHVEVTILPGQKTIEDDGWFAGSGTDPTEALNLSSLILIRGVCRQACSD